MPKREKLILAFFIWLGVYPTVLLMTWIVNTVGVDPPLPAKVAITTMFTVPIIEFIFLRRAKHLTARVEKYVGIDGKLRANFLENE